MIAIRAGSVALLRAQDAARSGAEVFAGRVVEDSSGEPVASAELKIHKAGVRELVADLDTDRAGHFAGYDLPAGDYTIDVVKPNFITTTFPLHLPNTTLQIRIMRYGVMDGRVTNVRGEPVEGIVRATGGQTTGATRIAVLTRQTGSTQFRSVRDTSLDDAGHFRFFDLPPGQYELGMWYYGLNEGAGMQLYPDNSNPRIFTIAGGEVYNNLNFLVTPNPQYKVAGTVTIPDTPNPSGGFALALGLPDQPVLPIAIAIAGKDGKFQFDKVPAGVYDLYATGPTGGYTAYDSTLGKGDAYFAKTHIQVAGSDVTGLSLTLTPARSLSLRLRPHGNAPYPAVCPQSATVTLTSLDPWAIVFFNANGPVSAAKDQSIPNLAPGRFRIAASGLGAGCYQAGDLVVDLAKDVPQPVGVELAAAGSVHGTLHAARAGDFTVALLDTGNAQTAGNPDDTQSLHAFPNAEGHFVFEGLHPGRYRIGAGSSVKEIEVTGGEVTNVDLSEGVPQ